MIPPAACLGHSREYALSNPTLPPIDTIFLVSVYNCRLTPPAAAWRIPICGNILSALNRYKPEWLTPVEYFIRVRVVVGLRHIIRKYAKLREQ